MTNYFLTEIYYGRFFAAGKIIEDKKTPFRMSDAEIMVILILFHSGGFAASSIITRVCKHLEHLFRTSNILWNWNMFFP